MSVVVWDGTTLAADRLATQDGVKQTATKISSIQSGEILAWVGGLEDGRWLADWYRRGALPDEWPTWQRREGGGSLANLIVAGRGAVCVYYSLPIPELVEDMFAAWGSGAAVALGAMEMGANSFQAVEAACKWADGCGGEPVRLKPYGELRAFR